MASYLSGAGSPSSGRLDVIAASLLHRLRNSELPSASLICLRQRPNGATTGAAIARAREHFPEPATNWIVCGGGRHNRTLMDELRARVNAPVLSAEDAGWNGDFIEAEAFAYLSARSVRGLPLSLPSTTGVAMPVSGGRLHRAK